MLTDEFPKATPRPWVYSDNGFDGGICSSEEKEREPKYPTLIFGGERYEGRIEPDDQNAQLVLHVVNTYDARETLLREAADAWVQVYSRVGLDPNEPTGSVERMRLAFMRIEAALKGSENAERRVREQDPCV